jgi:NADH-quinone oxidoreductase subunit G
VATPRGAITLPLEITEMPDRVVWLPLNSPGSQVNPALGASPGDVVAISVGGELA